MDTLVATSEEIAKNVASLEAIPETHIIPYIRAAYIARAQAGEDIQAYGLDRLARGGIANLWIVDTRIPLAPSAHYLWIEALRLRQVNGGRTTLLFIHFDTKEKQRITVTIERHVGFPDSDPHYEARAERVIEMISQTIALYQVEPSHYDGCTF